MSRLVEPVVLKDHIETDLSDDALARLSDDAEAEIVRRIGPLTAVTEEFRFGTLDEYPEGQGIFLSLGRPASSVTSINETVGTTTTTLATDDYRLVNGRVLERLRSGTNGARAWGEFVSVVYVPEDDTARRTRVIIDLVRLAVEYRALKSEKSGDYGATYADYSEERGRLIMQLAGAFGAFA